MSDDFFQGNDGFLTSQTTYITQNKVKTKKKNDKKKGNTLFYIISATIILIAVVTTAAFFLLSDTQKDDTQVEKLTKDIITSLQQSDLSEFKSHLLPSLLEAYDKFGGANGTLAYKFRSLFLTPEFDFLDYTVKSETDLIDDNPFPGLVDYPSYVEPSDLAQVEIEISYGSQKSSVYFKYAYCTDRYYLYDVDDSEYDLDFSDYKFSNTVTSDEISDLLADNVKTVEEPAGELISFDEYSLTLPENWSVSTTEEAYLYSDSGTASIKIDTDLTLAYGEEIFFETLVDKYNEEGFVATDAGTIKTDSLTGYYIDFYIICDNAWDAPTNLTLVIYPKDGVAYSLFILRYIKGDSAWDEAMKVAESFKFE